MAKELSYREKLGYPKYEDPGIDCTVMEVTDQAIAKELEIKIIPGQKLKVKSPKLTEDSHAEELDINKIVKRWLPEQILNIANDVNAVYGDFTKFTNLQDMTIEMERAKEKFNQLPAEIRRAFDNNPGQLVKAIDQAEAGNVFVKDELEKLGVLRKETPKEQAVVPPPVTPPATPKA